MQTKTEDMDVTKLEELVARIPEQLSLHVFDFAKNCYVFYKFTVLKFMHILQIRPWKFLFF